MTKDVMDNIKHSTNQRPSDDGDGRAYPFD
jgi:hypothetical protein